MRILIVEDEFKIADVIASRLRKENYIVDVFDNGEAGLNNALTNIYDLIILDVMLPKVDGFKILEEIRREKINAKVIMLTAKSMIEDKLMGFNSGANDYLTKPFGVMEFVSRIRALLRRFSSKKKQISVIGNRQKIELNKDAREVFVKGEKCPLTYKEFELLQVLMSHADQVMTAFFCAFYPGVLFPFIYLTRELSWGKYLVWLIFISSLICEAGSQIQTIRNVGYCFRKTEDETE